MGGFVPPSTPGKAIGPKDPMRRMVWPIMFAQYFALGLMRPEMPGILLELFGGSMENVALYQGATDAVGALVAFALVPMIGDFSDHKGRKPALLVSALCAAAPVFVLALYGTVFGTYFTIVLYALVALVSKLNSYSVALSFVADCSTIEQRSSVFGEVSGVMFVGLTGGPLVSGFLPRGIALTLAAFLNVAAALYIMLLMPETLGRQKSSHSRHAVHAEADADAHDPEKKSLLANGASKSYGGAEQGRDGAQDAAAAPVTVSEKPKKKRGFLMAWNFLTQNRLYALIGLITLISQLAVFGVGQIYFLYLAEEGGFERVEIIRAALIGGAETIVVMLVGMPWLSQHMHESSLMLIGLASYLIYALGLASSAASKLAVFAIIIFWSLSGLSFPATCSLLSAHTPHEQTGLAQGALSAVRCCASGLGPAVFALFFSRMVAIKREHLGPGRFSFIEDTATVGWGIHYTALPFVLGALLIFIAMVLTLWLPSTRQKSAPKTPAHPSRAQGDVEQQQPPKERKSSSAEFVMPPARSSKSRMTWFIALTAVCIGTLMVCSYVGHYFADEPVHDHIHAQNKQSLVQMHNVHFSHSATEGVSFVDNWAAQLDTAVVGKDNAQEAQEAAIRREEKFSATEGTDAQAQGDEEDEKAKNGAPDADEPADEESETEQERASELARLHDQDGATASNASKSAASPRLLELSALVAEQKQKSADKLEKRINGAPDQQAVPRKGAAPPAAKADHEHGDKAAALLSKEDREKIAEEKRIITVMALMGPPGVGKTALSRHLTEAYGLTPLSSGVLIRSEIARETPLGLKIKHTVETGGLVDDALVLALVEKEISRLRAADPKWPGVILDGFPRTLNQARMLDAADSPIPPLSPMVYVHMRDDILAERREGRRLCPVCGATYNMNPIDHDGYVLKARRPDHDDQTTCSRDNATLVRRPDDREDIAQHRMQAFRNESLPMAPYYEAQGKLISIEKTRGAKTVFKLIRADLERLMAQQRLELERRAKERPQKLPQEVAAKEDQLRRTEGPASGLVGSGEDELVYHPKEEEDNQAEQDKKEGEEPQPTAKVQGKQRASKYQPQEGA